MAELIKIYKIKGLALAISILFILLFTGCINQEIGTETNHPPTIPDLASGSISTKQPWIFYLVSASSTDPDGDKLSYYFDWGDGTSLNSTFLSDSGQIRRKHHSWDSSGNFTVKVKAIDNHSVESDWAFLKVNIGEPEKAPDFTLSTLDHGNFTLSDHLGKVVVINFMATRCFFCRNGIDEIKALPKETRDSTVIITIDVWFFHPDESEENLGELKENKSADWVFAMDSPQTNVIGKYYEDPQLGISLPLIFVIDTERVTSYSSTGIVGKEKLLEEINKAKIS